MSKKIKKIIIIVSSVILALGLIFCIYFVVRLMIEFNRPKGYIPPDKVNYDTDGNKIRDEWHYDDGSIYRYYVYYYDDKGNKIKQEHYYNGDLSSYILYEYDAEGNRIKVEKYDDKGNLYPY